MICWMVMVTFEVLIATVKSFIVHTPSLTHKY
jgi:hypothetical protein